VSVSLCVIVIRNTAQNRSDYSTSYPPDSHHSSDDVYWRGGGVGVMMRLTIPHQRCHSGAAVSAATCISVQSPSRHSVMSCCLATADQQHHQLASLPRRPPTSQLHHPLGTGVCQRIYIHTVNMSASQPS